MSTRTLNQILLLEITHSEIRALLMNNEGVPIFAERIHHTNIVEGGHIIDQKSLSALIKELLKKIPHKVKRFAFALGDDIAFTRTFTPSTDLGKEDWERSLIEEIQNTLPVEGNALYWDYINIPPDPQSKEGGPEKKSEIVYTSALKQDVQDLKDLEKETGLSLLFIDVASLAQARSLLPTQRTSPSAAPPQHTGTMIVSLGETTAALNMYDHRSTLRTSGIAPFPGGQFTQNIVNEIIAHIDSPESFPNLLTQKPQPRESNVVPVADNGIQQKDVPPTPADSGADTDENSTATQKSTFDDSLSVLQLALEAVVSEIIKASNYYSEKTGDTIGNIVLAGGPAIIPGIDSYLQEKVGIPVTLGNPTQHLPSSDLFKKEHHQLLFTIPIGLGLRIMHGPEQGIDLAKKKVVPYIENKNTQQKNEGDFIGPRTVQKVDSKSKKIFGITFAVITLGAFGYILYTYLIIPMISG